MNNLQVISETKEHHGDTISKIMSLERETLQDKWLSSFKNCKKVTKGDGIETYILRESYAIYQPIAIYRSWLEHDFLK